MFERDWPDDMLSYFRTQFGEPWDVQRLQGVAGPGAACVRFPETSLIVKSSRESRERRFYEQQSRRLQGLGVHVPTLYWSGNDRHGVNWVVLEYIPHTFAKDRWTGDAAQLEVLMRLHAVTWGDGCHLLQDMYCPTWDDELTDDAHAWFVRSTGGRKLRSRLVEVQHRCQPLFAPTCSLSGDPNPTNWRVREDGSLVLIDWERFCSGHPAIDLAITLPGFGSGDGSVERKMASDYAQLWVEAVNDCPFSVEDLGVQIRLAKIWSIVEFIANAHKGPRSYPQETVMFAVNKLPSVLENLSF